MQHQDTTLQEAEIDSILEWIGQSRAMIRDASEQAGHSERPEFWDGIIEQEQKRIKDLSGELIIVKRAAKS